MKIDFKFPELVPIDLLIPNDYNPNRMPNKEMKLLKDCIMKYGFLYPIIVNSEADSLPIIDGEHRYRALIDLKSPLALVLKLYLTVSERMRLTVLMNRIKGMHQVESMSELVVKLSNLGLSDIDIAKELGMEAEEFIRLKQQLGIASYYRNHNYSKSWSVK